MPQFVFQLTEYYPCTPPVENNRTMKITAEDEHRARRILMRRTRSRGMLVRRLDLLERIFVFSKPYATQEELEVVRQEANRVGDVVAPSCGMAAAFVEDVIGAIDTLIEFIANCDGSEEDRRNIELGERVIKNSMVILYDIMRDLRRNKHESP